MKILLFTDSLGAGGAQRQLVGLAKLLDQEKYNVSILCYHKNEFYLPFIQECGIKYDLLNCSNNPIKRIISVIKYVRKENPDVLIAYQETPSLIACLVKIFCSKIKIIVSERSTTQKIERKDRIRFFLYKWVDNIVPNSYSQERFLKNNYSNLHDKIMTITNFVDLDKFSFYPKERSVKPLIVVAASVWPPKNTLGLIEAVRILSEKKYSFKIEWYGIVKGHEQYLNSCTELIKKYDLKNYIELMPKTNDIHEKYKFCDYFCLPSFFEGTPNVICEAIATGRPIVCSNVCDNSIYVKEDYNGFLFDPNNPIDIANNIEKLLLLPIEKYNTMCKNSREIAEELLSEENFVKKYITLIEE